MWAPLHTHRILNHISSKSSPQGLDLEKFSILTSDYPESPAENHIFNRHIKKLPVVGSFSGSSTHECIAHPRLTRRAQVSSCAQQGTHTLDMHKSHHHHHHIKLCVCCACGTLHSTRLSSTIIIIMCAVDFCMPKQLNLTHTHCHLNSTRLVVA